jgi:hypothetical protein
MKLQIKYIQNKGQDPEDVLVEIRDDRYDSFGKGIFGYGWISHQFGNKDVWRFSVWLHDVSPAREIRKYDFVSFDEAKDELEKSLRHVERTRNLRR